MSEPTQYEFYPAFRGDDYEWSPRALEPAEAWMRLAKQALNRQWTATIAEARPPRFWRVSPLPVSSAGARGGALAISPIPDPEGPAPGGADAAGLALLLVHCRQRGGIMAVPAEAWEVIRQGSDAASAILLATGRSGVLFHVRDLPTAERERLTSLADIVSFDAAPEPIDAMTRRFVEWVFDLGPARGGPSQVVAPDRSRALEAYLSNPEEMVALMARAFPEPPRELVGADAVEEAARQLRKLADLVATKQIVLDVVVSLPETPARLDLSAARLSLPADAPSSERIAKMLRLSPAGLVRPAPRAAPVASGGSAEPRRARPAGKTPRVDPLPSETEWGASTPKTRSRTADRILRPPHRDRFAAPIGLLFLIGAFLIGRWTKHPAAPFLPPPISGAPASPLARPPSPRTARTASGPSAEAHKAPTMRIALGSASAGRGVLGWPTCTFNGDVLRAEPDRLVISPCGTQDRREATCVGGVCRAVNEATEDLPQHICDRDGTPLDLDRDQQAFLPSTRPAPECTPAWYGVPSASDPSVALASPAPKRRTRAASHSREEEEAVHRWAQVLRTQPHRQFTVVGYPGSTPRSTDGCAQADSQLRAEVAATIDTLTSALPAAREQLFRPGAVRLCTVAPGHEEDAPAAARLLLVPGFVPSCGCDAGDEAAATGKERGR